MSLLRDMLRPVPDEALPDLRAYLVVGSRYMALSVAVIAPFGVVATSWERAASMRLVLLMAGLNSAIFFGIAGLASTSLGKRKPELTLFAFALAIGTMQMLAGVPMIDHRNPLPSLPLIVPAVVALFAPWRPALSVLLTVLLGAAWLLVRRGLGDDGGLDAGPMLTTLALSGGLAALANQMNRYLWARLQAAYRMAGMYELGCMTAGIAHEVKTPLAAAMNAMMSNRALVEELEASIGNASVGPDDLRAIAGDMRESVNLAIDANNRIASFIRAIREHTRAMNTVEKTEFAVAGTIDAVLVLMHHRVKHSALRFDRSEVDPEVRIEGDPGKLSQIVGNLVGNAVDACLESGTGSVIRLSAASAGGMVVLTVEDDGPGVPPELAARVFDVLFTTRGAKDGTGLGLSIARNLAEGAFGGSLALEAPLHAERGARFVLRLPHHSGSTRPEAAWTPASPPPEAPVLQGDA